MMIEWFAAFQNLCMMGVIFHSVIWTAIELSQIEAALPSALYHSNFAAGLMRSAKGDLFSFWLSSHIFSYFYESFLNIYKSRYNYRL